MNKELTWEQLQRIDNVDEEIERLIGSLIPTQYLPESGNWTEAIPHNIEAIGKVRDVIKEIISEALNIKPHDEAFEMAFYPFVDDEPKEKKG